MYRLVFISNFLSPHQLPLCKCFCKLLNNKFLFIATKEVSDERLKLGYQDLNQESFVLKSYENRKNLNDAYKIAVEADIVIIGSASDSFIKKRLKENKITFKYSERLLKNDLTLFRFPRYILGTWLHHGRFMKHPLYMLCAGGYVSDDFNRLGFYKNRCFKWGYFPEKKEYDVDALMLNKEVNSIIWVGRFLDWKHPEYALEIAKRLKNEGIMFKLRIIGSGYLETDIKNKIIQFNLENEVVLLGSMAPNDVRKYMEISMIHLFTSGRYEGWGAVLNESMNSGCVPIASDIIGATPYLIKNGFNGYLYKNENIDDLYLKVKDLIISKDMVEKCGLEAYRTISTIWNADVTAKRFLSLADDLLSNQDTPFESGPCSRAERLKS